MKTVIFSDLHLSETTKKLAEKLLKQIIMEKPDSVIFLGDWFEKKDRNPNALHKMTIDFISALGDKGTYLIFLHGNHDGYMKEVSNLIYLKKFGKYVRYITDPEVIDEYIFIPYQEDLTTEYLRELFEKNPQVKYCFCHIDIKDLLLPTGKRYPTGVDISVFTFLKCVYAGHIHHPQVVENVIVVGSPFARNFADVSPPDKPVMRGYFVLDDKGRHFVPFDAPFYVKLKNESDVEVFNKAYEGKRVHLWVEFDDSSVEYKAHIESKIVSIPVEKTSVSEIKPTGGIINMRRLLLQIVEDQESKEELFEVGKDLLARVGLEVEK